MVDLMCLQQVYKRREITKIKWISGGTNLADAMTKSKPCLALKLLVDTNKLDLQVIEQVERDQIEFTEWILLYGLGLSLDLVYRGDIGCDLAYRHSTHFAIFQSMPSV